MLVRRFFLAAFVLASMAGIGVPSASASVPSAIAVFNGANQRTHPGTSFDRPLNAIVTDSSGNPVSGVQVSFAAAPTGSASANLSSATAMTNAAGIASVTATANTTPGFYPVNASVAGIATPASFELGNIPSGYAVSGTNWPASRPQMRTAPPRPSPNISPTAAATSCST